jgi:transcriptional antiterminator RfaH
MWYVAATKPREEDRAVRHLTEQGFGTFLPRIRRTVRHARRCVPRSAPLFPGYVFIRGETATRWRSVNGTTGILHLITHGPKPAVVEAGFVEALQGAADGDGIVNLHASLRVGDRVEFSSGPMARRIGQLIALDDRGRAAVLMELLSGKIAVRTEVRDLLPA